MMTQQPVDWTAIGAGVGTAALLALRAYRKKSLTPAGSIAALGVGYLATSSSPITFAALLVFFLSSTFITKLGRDRKRRIDPDYHSAGHRSAWQVLCNGGGASVVLLANLVFPSLGSGATFASPQLLAGTDRSATARHILLAVVGHYAACQGDTWSSEVGVLAKQRPRLVTAPWRVVPTGTNGGVTALGTVAAVLGGFVLGLGCVATRHVAGGSSPQGALVSDQELLLVATGAALAGSLLDSVLGATLQYSGELPSGAIVETPTAQAKRITGYPLLSNNAVNCVTACAILALSWFTPRV